MPKKISQEEQDTWMELADLGLSPWEIRKRLSIKSDIRTIENVVYRNKAERADMEVRTRARTEALIDHWKQLVESPRQMEAVVRHPPRSFGGKLPVYAVRETRFKDGGWSARKAGLKWTVTLDFEESVDGKLLREHTGNDSFWKAFKGFGAAFGEFIGARLGMAAALSTAIEAAVRNVNLNHAGNTIVEVAGIEVCDQMLFRSLTDGSDPGLRPEESMAFSKDRSRLEVNGALLAVSDRELASDTSSAIAQAINDLRSSPEWKSLIAAHAKFGRTADDLKDEILVLRSVPSLPRTCRACARIA